jgi:preprotein translocase subunit SecF
MTDTTTSHSSVHDSGGPASGGHVPAGTAATGRGRLYRGQTAIDFVGRRRIGFVISGVLLVLTVLSLFTRGLDLGIDFEGGVSWDVPASEFTIAEAETVLSEGGIDPAGARIQRRASDSGEFIKIQVGVQDEASLVALQVALAEAAGVPINDVSVNAVSSSWGRDITDKAVRALLIFTVLVSVLIAIRYEWRMAVAGILAMIHDVVIAVGIYSLLGFVVTPATVIAFLTILGYSLYDTIVIFDRVRENEARFEARHPPYADVVNTTMNQVLMRTINTSVSSMVPVLSILIVGAGIMGAAALSEFAIALLVGMLAGAYSSIFVATPLLAMMKGSDDRWRGTTADRATGERLRELVIGGSPAGRRARGSTASTSQPVLVGSAAPATPAVSPSATTTQRTPESARPEKLLSHPPRPRKKKRR